MKIGIFVTFIKSAIGTARRFEWPCRTFNRVRYFKLKKYKQAPWFTGKDGFHIFIFCPDVPAYSSAMTFFIFLIVCLNSYFSAIFSITSNRAFLGSGVPNAVPSARNSSKVSF